ncbi:MAG: transporter permease [Conexibacter sp.]|nr:transporter permease [Conexibacter sp.]
MSNPQTGAPDLPKQAPSTPRGLPFSFDDAQRQTIKYVTLLGFVAMFILFSLLSPDVFPKWDNIRSILNLSSPIVILAVGLTVVLVVGEFDLSFTGVVAVTAVVAVKLMSASHASTTVAVLAGLGVGVAGGIVAGVLVSMQRASSFIVTLALGSVFSGVALGISGGGSTIADVTVGYTNLTDKSLLGVPLSVVYALVIALVVYGLLRSTIFGREAQAIGSNPVAARLAGIPLGTRRITAFAVMGLCAGVAGLILSSQTGQYAPGIAGGLFIPPFVAAFFGMSVLAAGVFNVFGTVVGALFIATLQTGLIVQGIQDWVASCIVGSVLLLILFIAAETREVKT